MCESAEMIGLAMAHLSPGRAVTVDGSLAEVSSTLPRGSRRRQGDPGLSGLELSIRGGGLERRGPLVTTGRSELGGRIAGDPSVTHDTGLTIVVGPGPVEDAAVVPDDHVAGTPPVRIRAGRPAGEIEEVSQELLRLGLREAGNGKGVAADEEGGAVRDGMHLHERAERGSFGVKAVARARLDHVPDLGLGVIERVMRGESRNAPAHRLVERIVGGSHVGP